MTTVIGPMPPDWQDPMLTPRGQDTTGIAGLLSPIRDHLAERHEPQLDSFMQRLQHQINTYPRGSLGGMPWWFKGLGQMDQAVGDQHQKILNDLNAPTQQQPSDGATYYKGDASTPNFQLQNNAQSGDLQELYGGGIKGLAGY